MRREYPEVPIDVVPGVSSLFAAAAEGLFPLAEGAEKLLVLPATAGEGAIRDALAQAETLVLLKVKPAFEAVLKLVAERSDLAVLFAERVGMAGQVILTDLAAIAAHKPDYLSLLVIRKVATSPE
jgi:precorrin-2/cobalt-factor-2 C20-methyltransferase